MKHTRLGNSTDHPKSWDSDAGTEQVLRRTGHARSDFHDSKLFDEVFLPFSTSYETAHEPHKRFLLELVEQETIDCLRKRGWIILL